MVSANYFDHFQRMEKDSRLSAETHPTLARREVVQLFTELCEQLYDISREDLLKQFQLLNRHKVFDRLLGSKDEDLLFHVNLFL